MLKQNNNGEWFFKAEPNKRKEKDKPPFKAIYGIEKRAKDIFSGMVDSAVTEMGKKLISTYNDSQS